MTQLLSLRAPAQPPSASDRSPVQLDPVVLIGGVIACWCLCSSSLSPAFAEEWPHSWSQLLACADQPNARRPACRAIVKPVAQQLQFTRAAQILGRGMSGKNVLKHCCQQGDWVSVS